LESVAILRSEVADMRREIGTFGGRVERIETNMTIDSRLHQNILARAKKHVSKLLGGADSATYKTEYKRIIQQLWGDYRQFLGICSYRDTKMVDYDRALEYIDAWRPHSMIGLEEPANAR
jgi:hypothetical protein